VQIHAIWGETGYSEGMGRTKQPQPQWDTTNKVWRWWDPTRRKHIRLGKASSKSDRAGRAAAKETLERYLVERGNPQSGSSSEATEVRNGLQHHAKRWLSKQRQRASKGVHSHEYARKAEVAISRMLKILGDGKLDRLSRSRTIEDYLKGMLDSDLSPKTISNHLGFVRRFIRDLYRSEDLKHLPRNHDELTIQVPIKHEKQQFTPKQLIRIHSHFHDAGDEQWECWFLLALNCGMQEADISELRVGDWRTVQPRGCARFERLDTKRVKTRRKSGVPPMQHCLWRRTSELLRNFAKGKNAGERVFARPNGRPLRYETPNGGSVNNYLSPRWSNLVQEIVPENPLGMRFLRTTGANLCERKIAGSKFLYLSHSMRTVADMHYANFPLEKLDQVLSYIEKDLGLVDEIVGRCSALQRKTL